jgi:predicted AAA+ superfamily ATPase
LAALIGVRYEYSLSQYRDRVGREIDFVVENADGKVLCLEVKAGSLASKDDCKHMAWFARNIIPGRSFTGVVLYTGDTTLPLGPDMYAVPIAALWG